MNFLIRGAAEKDIKPLMGIAQQFSLLNLPADEKVIAQKIGVSIDSFKGNLKKEQANYIFVLEDLENGRVAGTSQIKAIHGTPEEPAYSFEILKKERFSKDLGVGFIHQILRLKINEAGPTEIGGLVVDKNYRRRPEKIGKIISLGRFLYIGMYPERFQPDVYAQMAPPLTDDGRSEFWEALGRRFTGMPYKEADVLSQQNKEFIRSLFPEEDIYLCLLDAQARLVMGCVNQQTQGALYMLESVGLKIINEVDPFDGGPHMGAKTKDISLIKNCKKFKLSKEKKGVFNQPAFIAVDRDGILSAGGSSYRMEGDEIVLPEKAHRALQLNPGEEITLSPVT